ncbi:MAG: TRAP transporter small permease subunit [Betaproteobacteria bacterium]|nr:TRAP transporter small permease subunit [Betaproteobacteria bacterium]MBI3937421.1 TRAP transporter small permease subunit [Betaproteobacteria bacterium]
MTLARVRAAYEKFLEAIVIVLMAVLAAEVTAGVIFRSLGRSLVWYDEVASILLAWLTFYGSALAAAKRAHIGCPEVVAMLPPFARVVLRAAADALVIAFFALVGWTGYSILEALATDRLVSLPEVPVVFVQSVIPVSALLIVVAELLTLPAAIAQARGERAPGAATAAAAREATH